MDKQTLSFEIGKRLKQLRDEKGLSLQELADALTDRYGIRISKDSLRDYEIQSEFRAKAKQLPNLGMRAEYLIALADFYGVSTDYLLGKTNTKTTDAEKAAVLEYTGLTENALDAILRFSSPDYFDGRIIGLFNSLLSVDIFILTIESMFDLLTSCFVGDALDTVSTHIAELESNDKFLELSDDEYYSFLCDVIQTAANAEEKEWPFVNHFGNNILRHFEIYMNLWIRNNGALDDFHFGTSIHPVEIFANQASQRFSNVLTVLRKIYDM